MMSLEPSADHVFASVNIVCAVAVALMMMDTTPQASIRRSFYDPQAMWAMMRRGFYISMAGACAGMGFFTLMDWVQVSAPEKVFWSMLVVPLTAFLAIRWLRLVDQDRWVGFSYGQRARTAERAQHRAATTGN